MDIYVYEEGMSCEEQVKGAYWERNMLVLLLANVMNELHSKEIYGSMKESGWYYDTDGWKRVISLERGKYCFHIPDDFNIGDLPQIEKNWDGHTTEEKWRRVCFKCGVKTVRVWEADDGMQFTEPGACVEHNVKLSGKEYSQEEIRQMVNNCKSKLIII
jgi:hypothetical protein